MSPKFMKKKPVKDLVLQKNVAIKAIKKNVPQKQ